MTKRALPRMFLLIVSYLIVSVVVALALHLPPHERDCQATLEEIYEFYNANGRLPHLDELSLEARTLISLTTAIPYTEQDGLHHDLPSRYPSNVTLVELLSFGIFHGKNASMHSGHGYPPESLIHNAGIRAK